jgi:hypothetical protein
VACTGLLWDQHAQGVAASANYAGEVEFEIGEHVLRPSVGEELHIPAGCAKPL